MKAHDWRRSPIRIPNECTLWECSGCGAQTWSLPSSVPLDGPSASDLENTSLYEDCDVSAAAIILTDKPYGHVDPGFWPVGTT